MLEDNVVLQCGFANRKHMAPFVKVDVQGTHRKLVQVNKGARWFVAAVGGPQLKKGDMPTVTVLEELMDKLAENIKNDDAARSAIDEEPETAVAAIWEGQEGDRLVDPMLELNCIEDSPPLETPKKKRKPCSKKHRKPQFATVRTVLMPKRPPCAQCGVDANLTKTVLMWVKPKSKTLWIELEDIDWLCSYAADQHHFQATADSKNAVAATSIEWDFIGRAWDVKLMRQSYHIPRDIMTDGPEHK